MGSAQPERSGKVAVTVAGAYVNDPLRNTENTDIALGRRSSADGQQFEPLLNDEQAACLLGNMHPRTLQRLARTGVIPAIKIGRFWFFRASTLDVRVSSQVQFQHRPCFSKEKE